ncbi:MAG: TrmB family transcriptional regulator [bacterium]
MKSILELLQKLGFGAYEAQAYVTLLQNKPLNGYELAKASGLPRPNVYNVLKKLEDRGAVVRLETSAGTRYASVSPQELTQKLGDRFHQALEDAQRSLEEIAGPVAHDYVWNTKGYASMLEEARAVINAAQSHLLVALWHHEAARLAEYLSRAEARGVAITTLCMEACPQPCAGCRGHIYRYRVALEHPARWLVLIADAAEVLAAEIDADEKTLAVRTRQKLLVDLSAWYIRHTIALAALVSDLGGSLENLLTSETRAILTSVGPLQPNESWLAHMRGLLDRTPTT